jgi:hypothetical protein
VKLKFTFYTKWEDNNLVCSCYIKNPQCDCYKSCEELELILDIYGGIEECMRNRKYIKEHGVIKQR